MAVDACSAEHKAGAGWSQGRGPEQIHPHRHDQTVQIRGSTFTAGPAANQVFGLGNASGRAGVAAAGGWLTFQDHATQRVRIVTPPSGRPPARAAVRTQKWDHMLSWISLASRSLL